MLVRSMRVDTSSVMGMFLDCSAVYSELGCVFDGTGLLNEESTSGNNSVE